MAGQWVFLPNGPPSPPFAAPIAGYPAPMNEHHLQHDQFADPSLPFAFHQPRQPAVMPPPEPQYQAQTSSLTYGWPHNLFEQEHPRPRPLPQQAIMHSRFPQIMFEDRGTREVAPASFPTHVFADTTSRGDPTEHFSTLNLNDTSNIQRITRAVTTRPPPQHEGRRAHHYNVTRNADAKITVSYAQAPEHDEAFNVSSFVMKTHASRWYTWVHVGRGPCAMEKAKFSKVHANAENAKASTSALKVLLKVLHDRGTDRWAETEHGVRILARLSEWVIILGAQKKMEEFVRKVLASWEGREKLASLASVEDIPYLLYLAKNYQSPGTWKIVFKAMVNACGVTQSGDLFVYPHTGSLVKSSHKASLEIDPILESVKGARSRVLKDILGQLQFRLSNLRQMASQAHSTQGSCVMCLCSACASLEQGLESQGLVPVPGVERFNKSVDDLMNSIAVAWHSALFQNEGKICFNSCNPIRNFTRNLQGADGLYF